MYDEATARKILQEVVLVDTDYGNTEDGEPVIGFNPDDAAYAVSEECEVIGLVKCKKSAQQKKASIKDALLDKVRGLNEPLANFDGPDVAIKGFKVVFGCKFTPRVSIAHQSERIRIILQAPCLKQAQ